MFQVRRSDNANPLIRKRSLSLEKFAKTIFSECWLLQPLTIRTVNRGELISGGELIGIIKKSLTLCSLPISSPFIDFLLWQGRRHRGGSGAAGPTGAGQWGQDYAFDPTEICPWKMKFEELFCTIQTLAAMCRTTCPILRVKFSPLGQGWIPA